MSKEEEACVEGVSDFCGFTKADTVCEWQIYGEGRAPSVKENIFFLNKNTFMNIYYIIMVML